MSKNQQLDELGMSDLVGARAAAGASVLASKLNPFGKTSGKTTVKDKMAADSFVQSFISHASENLSRAIKAGLVDPGKKKPATVPAQQPSQPAVEPTFEDVTYHRLNQVFESILEATGQQSYPDTISSYLQKLMQKFMGKRRIDPATASKIKSIADTAEANYNSLNPAKRGARTELSQLGNMALALNNAAETPVGQQQRPAKQPVAQSTSQTTAAQPVTSKPITDPKKALEAVKGILSGLTGAGKKEVLDQLVPQATVQTPSTPQATKTAPTPAAKPVQQTQKPARQPMYKRAQPGQGVYASKKTGAQARP